MPTMERTLSPGKQRIVGLHVTACRAEQWLVAAMMKALVQINLLRGQDTSSDASCEDAEM